MSSDFGQQNVYQGGREIRTIAKDSARWKTGGVTIDWSTVAANAGGTTLPDGTIVPAGTKFLRYGQVLSKITASGKFGPVDTAAADGRQTVTNAKRGEAFILDRTVAESEPGSNVIGDVYDGGNAFVGRLLVGGGGGQPTLQNVIDMFPALTFTKD